MTVRRSGEVSLEEVAGATSAARQVLVGPDLSPHFAIRRFVMEPGGGMPLHTNEVEHGQYVLAGRATIVLGDEEVRVQAGDSLHIPARLPHSYTVEGDEPFEFLCVVPNADDEVRVLPKET